MHEHTTLILKFEEYATWRNQASLIVFVLIIWLALTLSIPTAPQLYHLYSLTLVGWPLVAQSLRYFPLLAWPCFATSHLLKLGLLHPVCLPLDLLFSTTSVLRIPQLSECIYGIIFFTAQLPMSRVFVDFSNFLLSSLSLKMDTCTVGTD